MKKFELAIIGAGIAGRALAKFASEAGVSCCLIESAPLDGFSSVKNQGWLHSGALYAARNGAHAEQVAQACRSGAAELSFFNEQHELNAIGCPECFFVYDDDVQLDKEFKLIQEQGIFATKIDRDQLMAEEAMLGSDTKYVGGIQTTDTTVNTTLILNKLMEVACLHGCQTYLLTTCKLHELQASKSGDGWRLQSGELDIDARVVVCAAGAMIPDAVQRMIGQNLGRTSVNKCLVVAINSQVPSKMLVSRTVKNEFMNIAPYSGGITINLGNRDILARDWTDDFIDDDALEELQDHLLKDMPLLRSNPDAPVSTYVCHKLNIGNNRHFHWERCGADFFVYYPGKFTQALSSARSIFKDLSTQYQFARSTNAAASCNFSGLTHPGTRKPSHILSGGCFIGC